MKFASSHKGNFVKDTLSVKEKTVYRDFGIEKKSKLSLASALIRRKRSTPPLFERLVRLNFEIRYNTSFP